MRTGGAGGAGVAGGGVTGREWSRGLRLCSEDKLTQSLLETQVSLLMKLFQ